MNLEQRLTVFIGRHTIRVKYGRFGREGTPFKLSKVKHVSRVAMPGEDSSGALQTWALRKRDG